MATRGPLAWHFGHEHTHIHRRQRNERTVPALRQRLRITVWRFVPIVGEEEATAATTTTTQQTRGAVHHDCSHKLWFPSTLVVVGRVIRTDTDCSTIRILFHGFQQIHRRGNGQRADPESFL